MKEMIRRMEHKGAVSRRWVPVILAAVVGSFIVATAFVQWRMMDIDVAADGIADNTAPSIEHLANARGELRHIQTLLDTEHEEATHGRIADPTSLDVARRALDEWIDGYLEHPPLPGEREHWMRVSTRRTEFRSALAAYTTAVSSGDEDQTDAALEALRPSMASLYDALTDTIRANAASTLDFARQIQEFRQQTTVLAVVLEIACAVVAVLGFVLVTRMNRAHVELLDRHRRVLEERASELEAFAARVAHDVLSPLANVSLALHLAIGEEDPERRRQHGERAARAVERIKRLVNGLLEFARAGGKPAPGARAHLRTIAEELEAGAGPTAAEAGATLHVDVKTDAVLACNPGVLTSVISNLLTNAIKYLGDAVERRITLRARDVGARVRVEVTDTGPGIPPELESRLFQPYARASGVKAAGFGLGLATVKRLVEAHGGAVGVVSAPGAGSTFWFELPKATAATAKERDAPVSGGPRPRPRPATA